MGIAENKLLAKIASDMNKPNGQCVVPPDRVTPFMESLPVRKLWGIGGVSEEKLERRGIDDRPVQPHRLRKSLSTEQTYSQNLSTLPECERRLATLHADLMRDLARARDPRPVRKVFVKLKFANFTRTTAECVAPAPALPTLNTLLEQAFRRGNGLPVRLLGAGVRFAEASEETEQLSLDL